MATPQKQSEINPAEQALVILELCRGDLQEAREVCVINMLGDSRRVAFWQAALRTLYAGGTS